LKENNFIIEFKGCGSYFKDLNGHNKFIYERILSITRDERLKEVERLNKDLPPVGIHIRRGDFFGRKLTPINWFVESLRCIREYLGYNINAFVVSDGKEDELRPLLETKGVILLGDYPAITLILALSQAKILIASGSSTLSGWASFLGQMPTISCPGQPLGWFNLKDSIYLGEFNPDFPDENFIKQVKNIFMTSVKVT
jgi:hypothetical protein